MFYMLSVGILESQNKCVFAQIYFKFCPVQALTPVNTPKALHYTNTFYVCTLCNNFLNDYTISKNPLHTAADKKKGGGTSGNKSILTVVKLSVKYHFDKATLRCLFF